MAEIEKVVSDLEQQIRWIEEIECHKFPGWLNVTNAMRDALELLKEQDKDITKISNEYLNLVKIASKQPKIVRCKDCEWWDKKPGSPYGYCNACKHGYSSPNWEIGIYRTYTGDFFCADGELRN